MYGFIGNTAVEIGVDIVSLGGVLVKIWFEELAVGLRFMGIFRLDEFCCLVVYIVAVVVF